MPPPRGFKPSDDSVGFGPPVEMEQSVDAMNLPDPEVVAASLVELTRGVLQGVNCLSEEKVSCGLQLSFQKMAVGIDELLARLPSAPEDLSTTTTGPEGSDKGAALGLTAATEALLDVRSSLVGIQTAEIQEVIQVGLPLVRAAAAGAHASAVAMQRRVTRRSGVVIEDLNSEEDLPESLPEEIDIIVCQPRRYFWRPLWPRLCTQLWPCVRERSSQPLAFAADRPLIAASAVVVLGPTVLVCSPMVLAGAYCGSVVLMADMVVQRLYGWKGPEIEDALDGAVQTANFSYVSARFLARQSVRIARKQTSRLLERHSVDSVWDLVDEVRKHPLDTASAAVGHTISALTWAGRTAWQAPSWSKGLQDVLVGALSASCSSPGNTADATAPTNRCESCSCCSCRPAHNA